MRCSRIGSRNIVPTEDSLYFSPDGRWLAITAQGNSISLIPAPFTTVAHNFDRHISVVCRLAINPQGTLLASGSSNGELFIWNMPSDEKNPDLRTSLLDLAATDENVKAGQYTLHGSTYVAPCGTPLPPGVVCICNCVSGGYALPKPVARPQPVSAPRDSSGGGGTICTCDKICTCVPIK